jgi:acyl-CoA synthetase (AMP-forming)/AMP-acid ligase II
MNALYAAFAESVERYSATTALIDDKQRVSYAGLKYLVDEKAALFKRELRAVTLPVSTCVDSVVELLACAKHGVCVVPLPAAIDAKDQLKLTEDVFGKAPAGSLEAAPFLLLYTSGTTSAPKLIALSQETKVLRAQQFAKLYGLTEDDEVLVGTPLHYSMAQRLVFTSLLCGATARLLPAYSPELWLAAAVQCSVVVGLPQQLRHFKPAHLPRVVLNTSAPRSADYVGSDCWGTSEVAIATSLRPLPFDKAHPLNLVGHAAPGVTLRIEPDGEIVVKTPLLFSGYFSRPDLTAAALTRDGYFLTGDAGSIDSRGLLHLHGRLNDVIKVGGVKVYPEEVEAALATLPGVVECAAVGRLDDKLGEHVHAVLVMTDPHTSVTLRKIQHHCAQTLLSPSIPRSFEFVKALPHTETGKLLRRALK